MNSTSVTRTYRALRGWLPDPDKASTYMRLKQAHRSLQQRQFHAMVRRQLSQQLRTGFLGEIK